MQKVAFVCIHNSCRSQIAEAFLETIRLIEEKVLDLRKRLK